MKRLPTKILSAILSVVMIFSVASTGASAKSFKSTEQKAQVVSQQNTKHKQIHHSDEEDPSWDFDFDFGPGYVDTIEKNGLIFDLYDDYTAVVSTDHDIDGTGHLTGNVTIPSSITYEKHSYKVDYVGDFSNCEDLISITLPDTIVSITDTAFASCPDLEKVIIPDKCEFEYFGDNVFSSTPFDFNLSEKETVTFGKNVLYSYNKAVTSYTVPENINIIASNAFRCSNISKITFPSELMSIGSYAFANCTGITEITIPDSVLTIGDGCFKSCSAVKKITLGNGLIAIGSTCFSGTAIETINIPAELEDCTGAFMNCEKLRNITVDSKNETFHAIDGVLFGDVIYYDLFTGEKATSKCLFAYPIAKTASKYVVPEKIDEILLGAFCGSKYIKTVDLSKSEDVILNDYAFANSTIENYDFSKSSYVGSYAFSNCQNITNLDLSDVYYIDGNGFYDCANLKEVKFSDEVFYIGDCAFSGTALETVTVYGDECAILGGAFSNCPNLKEVTFGDGVFYIGEKVFFNSPSLETVTLSKTITEFEDFAFDGCDNVLFKVIKRSEAYKAVKAEKLNFEIVGRIPLIEIIFNKIAEFFSIIFWWI